jgi:hypothetical protein
MALHIGTIAAQTFRFIFVAERILDSKFFATVP